MIGFYQSFLVIALGVLVSAADLSLFGIDIGISLPERSCGKYNTVLRKEWFVFPDFPGAN